MIQNTTQCAPVTQCCMCGTNKCISEVLSLSLSIYIYIYIYMCVCVCVCVCVHTHCVILFPSRKYPIKFIINLTQARNQRYETEI